MLHAAIEAGVERVVCLSTDKAAYPINAMGISKAMMEHVIYANARVAAERGGTVICCTRYGNVMASRGSVIPLFVEQIKACLLYTSNPLTIILNGYRNAFLYHSVPGMHSLIVLAIMSFAVLAVGMLTFKKLEKGFAEQF